MTTLSTPLKHTPLHAQHVSSGGKMVDFGGWHLPIQYKEGIKKEHARVREHAGLFDVSHMGQIVMSGKGAQGLAEKMVTGRVKNMAVGDALYTLMCLPHGGIVDDCIVYKKSDDRYLFIVNASNETKDYNWIQENAKGVELENQSADTGLIAIQGPKAIQISNNIANTDLSDVGRFKFIDADLCDVPCMIARTGYTGEDGFEIACPAASTEKLWNALLENGESKGLAPIGLGARDTLRLEAKLSLYGNDIDETTTPLEASLGWAVKLDDNDFIGKDALVKQKAEGIKRKLVGFKVDDRGTPRAGYELYADESLATKIGNVTSGSVALTVGGSIGMGYVELEHSKIGTPLYIKVRDKSVKSTIVKGAFYKRKS